MIPRLKPYFDASEIKAVFKIDDDSVFKFEQAFASLFDAKYALAFPYGRSALWAFFKSHGIEGAEIILPAYTCVVVAHAIVLSGNTPKFVDIQLADYNMDLDLVEKAINDRTRAIIATHLFGYPLKVERLNEIVRAAEARIGHKIWVIQDCAHSFGAKWNDQLVCSEGDFALYGLNISKTINSIFGGMITTDDEEIYQELCKYRGLKFRPPGNVKNIMRASYLAAVAVGFSPHFYTIVDWLQHRTPLLKRLTHGYHLDDQIRFPPDYLDLMTAVEASVGCVQLMKYPEIIRSRECIAESYDELIEESALIYKPPIIKGATYSHYPIRVQNRAAVKARMREVGVEVGEVIQYSIPHMMAYQRYVGDPSQYPNSLLCSREVINLPIYPGLSEKDLSRIVELFRWSISEFQ